MRQPLPCFQQTTWHASGQRHNHLSHLNGYLKTSFLRGKKGRNTLDNSDHLLACKYVILRHSRQLTIKRAMNPHKEKQVSFRWMVPEAHKKTVENDLTYEGKIEKAEEVKGIVWVF